MDKLTLTRVYPAPHYGCESVPFPDSADFDEDWWNDLNVGGVGSAESDFLYRIEDSAGREVSRVLIVEDVLPISDAYRAPGMPSGYLEIKFFEVAASARRRGIGARVAELVRHEFPDSPLVAFSEGGDDFWSSLEGWSRFENQESPRNQVLFISLPTEG